MSILIKGIKVPRPGEHHFLLCVNDEGEMILMGDEERYDGEPFRCIEVPTPHGKLIGADEMAADESEAYMSAQVKVKDKITRDVNMVVHTKLQMLLADAPAVIEAEEG